MTYEKQTWEVWIEKYKATELGLLVLEWSRMLLKYGETTAECIHHIPVSNASSLRGAAARTMRRLGIAEKCAVEFGNTKQSHGHTMFRWRLINRERAQEIVNGMAEVVLGKEREAVNVDADGQGVMNI